MDKETADHEKTAYGNLRKHPAGNPVERVLLDLSQQGIGMGNNNERSKQEPEKIEIIMTGCVIQSGRVDGSKETLK